VGSVGGFKEVGIFSVQNDLLQRPFSGVDQAMANDGFQFRRDVSAEGHRTSAEERGGPFAQEFLEVFSRVGPYGRERGSRI